jgi:predicted AlkP superfamily pyrophosphatase or phosphodiesterase
MTTRRAVFLFFLLGIVAVVAAGGLAGSAPRSGRAADHVVLISIDGLRPAMYLPSSAERFDVPALAALRDAGSFADGVVVSYPSYTYPSHTSLATGVSPARHGIVSNTRFDPPGGSTAWYFENEVMKAPALWDVARRHGLTSGGVSWPVSVGAAMDVLYPESNQAPRDTSWLALARRESTPGLIDAVVKDLGGFGEHDNRHPAERDRFAAAVATRIIRTARPNLVVVHFMETDAAQHAHGPGSPEARAALERIDAHVGAIVRATEEAGIRGRTSFVVTGDHGFYRVHSVLQPNVVLRDAGLLQTNEQGRIVEWQAALHGMAIRLREGADEALAARVVGLFEALAAERYRGIFRVVRRDELDRLGAYPEALLCLEPAEGYYLSDGVQENAFVVATARRGAHGYLPDDPRMHTGLVVAGAGVRAGVPLPLVRQIDIAPTIARLLGFDMPDVEGVALAGVLAE